MAKDYRLAGKYDPRMYFPNFDEWEELDRRTLCAEYFADFMSLRRMTIDDFMEGFNATHLLDRDLWQFDKIPAGSKPYCGIVVAKNYFYQTVWDDKNRKYVEYYYDVAVKPNTYLSSLNMIAKWWFKKNFPELFKREFMNEKRRFEDNIDKIDFSEDAPITNIIDVYGSLKAKDITIGDVMRIMENPMYKHDVILESKIHVYSTETASDNVCFYFSPDGKNDYECSICWTWEELFNRDVESIANRQLNVYRNGKFMMIPQRKIAVWNHPLVQQLLETIKNG